MPVRNRGKKQQNAEDLASPRDISAQINEELRKIQTEGSGGGNSSLNLNFSKLNRGPIEYFSPKDYGNDKTFHEMIVETAENKVGARLLRVIAVSFVPFVFLCFLAFLGDKSSIPNDITSGNDDIIKGSTNGEASSKTSNNNGELIIAVNFMFGAALFCMFTFYFLHIFFIFCSVNTSCICCRNGISSSSKEQRSLFRVYSVNSMIPDNTDMSVCYRALLFKYQPITSISEFSAIQGGIAQIMLLIISSYSWVVLLCAMTPEIYKYGFNILSIGDICELIGCYGLVLIGTFELDPWNKTMQWFHNTGAMMGSLTLVGFIYQQYIIAIHTKRQLNDTLIVPIILTVIAVIAYLFWNYFSNVANNYDPSKKNGNNNSMSEKEIKKIRQTVTSLSLKNVISEAFVLYSGSTAMCLWLMHFDTCHQHNFCRA